MVKIPDGTDIISSRTNLMRRFQFTEKQTKSVSGRKKSDVPWDS
jgi:hypothetical protein